VKQPKWLWGSFDEAMKRWSSAQLLRATEFVYATLALFALTQGPVYRLWSDSASEIDRLPSPSVPHAYFATFVALQLPAMALWFRRLDHSWLRVRGNQALVALTVWMVASVGWSTFARQSLPEVISLVLTTSFGLYLAASFSSRQFWVVIASAMAIGVGMSWLAVMRLWEGAVNFQQDYWVGIYYNRNSLAPVTAVAIVAAFALVTGMLSRAWVASRISVVVTLVGGGALATYAGIQLWKSGSQTSPLALLVAIGTAAVFLLIRFVFSKVSLLVKFRPYSASLVLLAGAVALFVALQFIGGFGGVSSEVATLNSRRSLWSLSWSGVLEKPWLGWGWMAAWWTDEFFVDRSWWATWGSGWSHNGYHDVLLGGGVVAAGLFFCYLWFTTRSLGEAPPQSAVPRLLLATFVLTAATQESFFIGSHFVWALLIASLAPTRAEYRLVEQQHSGEMPV
jgi:O-antigen ligase